MLERIKEYLDSFKGDDVHLVFENIEDDLKLEMIENTYEDGHLEGSVYYSDEYNSWYEVLVSDITKRAYVIKVIPTQIIKTSWKEV